MSESCFVHKNSYLSCLKTTGSVAAYKIDALAPPKKSEIFFAHTRADFVQFSAQIKFLPFFNLNFGLRALETNLYLMKVFIVRIVLSLGAGEDA